MGSLIPKGLKFEKRKRFRNDKNGKVYTNTIEEDFAIDKLGNKYFKNGNIEARKCVDCETEIKKEIIEVDITEQQTLYSCDCGLRSKSPDEKKIHEDIGHKVDTINIEVVVDTRKEARAGYVIKKNKITCGDC